VVEATVAGVRALVEAEGLPLEEVETRDVRQGESCAIVSRHQDN
jgi:hypothetical protein